MPLHEPETVRADMAACRVMLSGGSKSFAAAAKLLPRRVYVGAPTQPLR
jgi:hypothetical protein